MLESKGNISPSVEGIDQQDFEKIQLLKGAYPYQIGLQKRIPGKILEQVYPNAVGSIYVFYNVFGRHFRFTDFGSIEIQQLLHNNSFQLPALPPNSDSWIDTFSGYSPDGLVSKLWGAGAWLTTVGVCETIIQGWIDPFQVGSTLPPIYLTYPQSTQTYQFSDLAIQSTNQLPIKLPDPVIDPTIPTAPPGSVSALYPPNSVDLTLAKVDAEADNTCTGQGTQPVPAIDKITLYDYPTKNNILDVLFATGVIIAHILHWHGLKIGRPDDTDIGLVNGTCTNHGPAPTPINYYLIDSTGEVGVEP